MKRCTQCGIEKTEDAFEMQPSRGRLRAECRECRKQAQKKWQAKRKLNPPKSKAETKRCKQCREIKPIDEFSPSSPGYFHPRCKACENALRQEKRREKYKNDPTGRFYWPFMNEAGVMVKRCTYCYAEKQLSEFYMNGKHGRHGKCKECDKMLKKLVYANNPEKYRAISRQWAYRHPDKHRARYCRWAADNKEYLAQYRRNRRAAHHERFLAYDRLRHSKETREFRHIQYEKRRDYYLQYRERNKDRLNQYSRVWCQNNPALCLERENRRRAHKLHSSRIEKIDRMMIIERDKWTCYLCGQICTPHNVTLDHIIPLYRGGPHTTDNLRVACRPCNSRKGARVLGEFLL